MINCRFQQRREYLVSEYDIFPVSHVKLLKGQTKKSCTGDLLTDSYYCFSYRNKRDDQFGTFLCGRHAAQHFLELLGQRRMPTFDPLVPLESPAPAPTNSMPTQRKSEGVKETGPTIKKWHPATEQLHIAINLLIICWDTVPGKALLDIKVKLEKYYDKRPFPSQVKAINTILSRDSKKRTLQQMINDLRSKGNKIRYFKFDLLNRILEEEGVQSYFG